LSLKKRDEKLVIVDKLELSDTKTKLMLGVLEQLGISNAVIVIPERDDKVERSARNLPTVKVLRAEGINVYDLMRYEYLVLTEGALKILEKRLDG
tara:strand:+ start:427 stop:711 length:285 start_codon:yes stop_codon:yes gene_type:complete